jgi:hypothetical protein
MMESVWLSHWLKTIKHSSNSTISVNIFRIIGSTGNGINLEYSPQLQSLEFDRIH